MPKAQRMAQMLTVAEEIFAEQGYLATSMDEIAVRCGVSKPMLYEYFGSKEGLLIGCIHRARTELREKTAAAIAGAQSPEEFLRLVPHSVGRSTNVSNSEGWTAGLAAADLAELGGNERLDHTA